MDKQILLIAAGLLLMLAAILGYKKLTGIKKEEITKVKLNVSNTSITAGDAIDYQDNTPGATSWDWDFGDDEDASGRAGSHTYTTEGTYTIKLVVNGRHSGSTQVTVKPAEVQAPPAPGPVLSLSGPAVAKVGSKVTFTDNTPGATLTHWKFGESGMEDGTGKSFTYVYTRPGTYDVVATNDVSKNQAIRKIVIEDVILPQPLPGPKPLIDDGKPVAPPARLSLSDNDLKKKLKNFSATGFDYQAFSSLTKYLCDRDDIPVIYGAKTKDLNSYCKRLDFIKPVIVSVKQNKDPKTLCVTSIFVIEQ